MPDQAMLVQYFKEKNPELANYPDDAVASYVTEKFPDIAKQFMGASSRDVVGVAGEKGAGQTPFQRTARQHLANIGREQAAAGYEADIDAAKGQAMQTMAAAPLVAAAPFTGGLTAPAAMAVMGGMGLAGGLMRERGKILEGRGDEVPHGKALAISLGVDAITGAAGEGLARGFASVAKAVLPRMIVRAAETSADGAKWVARNKALLQQNVYQALGYLPPNAPSSWLTSTKAARAMVGGAEPIFQRLNRQLLRLPALAGDVNKSLTGLSPAAEKLVANMEATLATRGAMSGGKYVPLGALVRAVDEAKEGISALKPEEAAIFSSFADDLGKFVKVAVKREGPEAAAAFSKLEYFTNLQRDRGIAMSLGEYNTRRLIGRALGGVALGAAGAGVGYEAAGVHGATRGAMAGIGLGLGTMAFQKLSVLLVKQAMTNPRSHQLMLKAIQQGWNGNLAGARDTAMRAFVAVGARHTVNAAKTIMKVAPEMLNQLAD